MNKKDTIVTEAKRLFGRYGYLGFTLKQLAHACEMTSPALYYFYSSKADLFRDCLLSEFELRRRVLQRCAAQANTLPEFAHVLANQAIEVCELTDFRAGRALEEIIHLPTEMQQELRDAWQQMLIAPVEEFLARALPAPVPGVPRHLIATFIINLATFSAANNATFSREELAALLTAVGEGIQGRSLTSVA